MKNDKKIPIIKTAIKRFAKHGVNKTTLDEVARDIRMAKASLYYYFDSKESLYRDCLFYEVQQYILEVTEAINSGEEKETLQKLLVYFLSKLELQARHKLLWDIAYKKLENNLLTFEEDQLNFLIKEETRLIKEVLKDTYLIDKKELNFSLPNYIVTKSFGILFNHYIIDLNPNELTEFISLELKSLLTN